MSSPLYTDDLDKMVCPDCGRPASEDPMLLRLHCPVCRKVVMYSLTYFDSVLTFTCLVCNQTLIKIAVARNSK